jgi:hypothetical protein
VALECCAVTGVVLISFSRLLGLGTRLVSDWRHDDTHRALWLMARPVSHAGSRMARLFSFLLTVDVMAYMTNVTGTPIGVAHPRVHVSVTMLFHVDDSVG